MEALEDRRFLSASSAWVPGAFASPLSPESIELSARPAVQSGATGKSGRTLALRQWTGASAAAPETTSTLSATRATPAKSGKTLAARRANSHLLTVSPNGRYLVRADGSPFFYLGDTAWYLLDRVTRSEADYYLESRAAMGFTVVQMEITTRFGDNREGESPFINGDPQRPNDAYFEFLDHVMDKATSLGMYVSLVPLDTRGAKAGDYSPTDAYVFGRFLGARYGRTHKVIWTMGGDLGVDEVPSGITLWRELSAGIARGAANKDMSKVLFQYHPWYNQSSSRWFSGVQDAWLDAHGIQSGHSRNKDNYNLVAADYARSPARPVMDLEPGYEDIPEGLVAGRARLTDYDVRKSAYWAVFAGAHGAGYGHNNVWQFASGADSRATTASWKDSLVTLGAYSMKYLKRLMLSRPFLDRVPDQSLIVGSALSGTDHIRATRAADGSYAFVYTAGGKPVTVNLSKLSGSQVEVRWYNPRAAKSVYLGVFAKSGNRTFTPPTSGANNDWVLVVDDAAKRYGKP